MRRLPVFRAGAGTAGTRATGVQKVLTRYRQAREAEILQVRQEIAERLAGVRMPEASLAARHVRQALQSAADDAVAAAAATKAPQSSKLRKALELDLRRLSVAESFRFDRACRHHRPRPLPATTSPDNYNNKDDDDDDDDDDETAPGSRTGVLGDHDKGGGLSWYPGHIAKAEAELQRRLKLVDLVIEVRDARIPLSTSHPSVSAWVQNRPRIVALTHSDCIPTQALRDWAEFFFRYGGDACRFPDALDGYVARPNATPADPDGLWMGKVPVFFVDGRRGQGVMGLRNAAFDVSKIVNAKRHRKRLRARPVRVAVIGFPNVGKSAVINRLLGGSAKARSRDMPGVTRELNWISLAAGGKGGGGGGSGDGRTLELLDTPGIIPATRLHRVAATRLALCNDIGEAAYDNTIIATALIEMLQDTDLATLGQYVDANRFARRYAVDFRTEPAELVLERIAHMFCGGNVPGAAVKVLVEFRALRFGRVALELPPLLGVEDVNDVLLPDVEVQSRKYRGISPATLHNHSGALFRRSYGRPRKS